jgi:hypothetical protein
VSVLRGATGVLVAPVSYRVLVFVFWVLAALGLGHFYINFSGDLPDYSTLAAGTLRPGFWLTGSSCIILGLLILTESLIRPYDDMLAVVEEPRPVDDAERLWRGDYQICPYCGTLNEPDARACYSCRNLLFNFMGDRDDGDAQKRS